MWDVTRGLWLGGYQFFSHDLLFSTRYRTDFVESKCWSGWDRLILFIRANLHAWQTSCGKVEKKARVERSVARCLLFDAAFHESIIEWKLVFQAKAGGGSSFVRTLGSGGLESHAGSTRANTSTILFTPGQCAKNLADKWWFFCAVLKSRAVIWHFHFHFICIIYVYIYMYIYIYVYIYIYMYLCLWSKTGIHAQPLATKLKVRARVARCEYFSRWETFTWFSKTGAFMA